MAAQTIECQLAQGQIGRYLAGTDMSHEAVSQLELHISECPQCSFFVEAKRAELRRKAEANNAAVSVLDEAKHIHPFARNVTPPTEAMESLIETIRAKATPQVEAKIVETQREPAIAKPIHWKMFAYSAALGAVLLGMSHFTSNPTALFGERAEKTTPTVVAGATESTAEKPKGIESTGIKATGDPFAQDDAFTPPVTESDSVNTVEPKADTTDPKSVNTQNPAQPATPITTPTPAKTITPARSKPRTSYRRRSATRRSARTPRRTNRRPAQPADGGNSIRVYDSNGNPVSGG